MNEPLQEWLEASLLTQGDDLLWKEAAINQCVFVRDRLSYLVASVIQGDGDDRYRWRRDNPVRVVSTHTSKSVKLPVYLLKIPLGSQKISIRMRENFHGWRLSVESPVHVSDEFGPLFDRVGTLGVIYCEGFKDEWVFGSFNKRFDYPDGVQRFTIELGDNYELFTFIYLLMVETNAFGNEGAK